MRRDRVTIGHRTISYLIAEPPAPAARQHPIRSVVFLHAFPLQAASWAETIDAIPDGWRAIAPDLRGLGESPLSNGSPAGHGDAGDLRMTDFAGDVIDLLDRLGIAQAVVVGCSMGGYVLFEMLRNAPRYIAAVGLVSTRPGADSEAGRANRLKMIEQVDREGVDAIASQMLPRLLGSTTQRERPDLSAHVRNLIVGNRADGVRSAITAMMERGDSTALLAKIDVPALVVHGVEDALIPPGEAENMHRAIRTSRLELMPMCGHLPNLEHPSGFEALLKQFLSSL